MSLANYRKLCQWDSSWYFIIAKNGYVSTIPPTAQKWEVSNVAFFPGYPMLARVIHGVFPQIDLWLILLAVAQLAVTGFWFFILQSFAAAGLNKFDRALAVGAILFFPTSYFLVAAYSEPVFLCAATGFFYFLLKPRSTATLSCAAIAGFYASATRIVGLPLAAIPWLTEIDRPARWKMSGVTAISALGTLSFLTYTHYKFGKWNLYQETQRIGWGLNPQWSALIQSRTWLNRPPLFSGSWEVFDSGQFSNWLTSVFAWALLGGILVQVASVVRTRAFDERDRLALRYFLAGLLTYVVACVGMYTQGFRGMDRYVLPVFVFLILWAAWKYRGVTLRAALIALTLAELPLSLKLIARYTHGYWSE